MSRGFRDADSTQDLSEKATLGTIEEILVRDREQEQHAAERRAHGAYGKCEDCGKDIGAERLEALPSSTRCMSCQAQWEQSNRI
ncbi:MAG: TraR/DksA C4-type zinc finger protein [Candidatus Dormiibacterota bacterium]|jgi:RNA polymerase-binding transcription factor DksA